jgi:hypothetical protein
LSAFSGIAFAGTIERFVFDSSASEVGGASTTDGFTANQYQDDTCRTKAAARQNRARFPSPL